MIESAPKSRARIGRRGGTVMLVIFAIQVVAIAECPIPLDGSLFVRVERGHLIIDTSAQDSVTVEVSDSGVQVEEQCFDDHVEINGVVPARIYGRPLDWRITVPASVNLDLRTFAGSIRVSPTDGNVTARTAGGSVIAGDIGGSTAMITQGGSILVGNIGGNAELRSTGGGQIEIEGNSEAKELVDASVFDLFKAYQKILDAKSFEKDYEIEITEMSVTDRIQYILEILNASESVTFESLFTGLNKKQEVIVTFLAILELMRLKLLRVQQTNHFETIRIYKSADQETQDAILQDYHRTMDEEPPESSFS